MVESIGMNRILSPHFTLRELIHSPLARRHGMDNRPGPREVARLARLATHILEPVRTRFERPFTPSSGYRCPALNALVKSSPASQHIRGEAVDFELPGIANRDLAGWIRDTLIFDQLILEFHNPDVPDSGWVHCSYRQGNNRQMSLIFDGRSYREF